VRWREEGGGRREEGGGRREGGGGGGGRELVAHHAFDLDALLESGETPSILPRGKHAVGWGALCMFNPLEVLRMAGGVSTAGTLLKQQDCPHSEHSGIGSPHPLQICETVTMWQSTRQGFGC
jgi:hypothetical protein